MNNNTSEYMDWIGYYAMGYLDILQQSDLLEKIKELPVDDKEEKQFRGVAKKTFLRVSEFREYVKSFSQAMNQRTRDISRIPLEFRKLYMKYTNVSIKYQFFSDSMLAAIPLIEKINMNNNIEPLVNINALFHQLSVSMLLGFVEKFALRGCIEVGLATEISPNNFYGPIIMELGEIEKKEVKYPRILLWDRFLDFIEISKEKLTNPNIPEKEKKFIKIYLDSINNYIITDYDNKPILSYLEILDQLAINDEKLGYRDFKEKTDLLLPKACDFIRDKIREYTELDDENSKKWERRYRKVKKYFEKVNCWKPSNQ